MFFFQNVLSIDRTFLTIFFKELILSLVSMLKPFFCEILNQKISYKATHSERLSYKFENNLCTSIS